MLKDYLKRNSLTGQQFAAICGLKQYEISRVITGSRLATPRIARLIEKATSGEVKRADLRPDIFGDIDA